MLRRLPAELCTEIVAFIPPFCTENDIHIGAGLSGMRAIGPVSEQFEHFRQKRVGPVMDWVGENDGFIYYIYLS